MGFYGCKYVSARNTQYPFPDLIQTDFTKSRGRLTLSANEDFLQINFCIAYSNLFLFYNRGLCNGNGYHKTLFEKICVKKII